MAYRVLLMRLQSVVQIPLRTYCIVTSRSLSRQRGYQAVNEPVLNYVPASKESLELEEAIEKYENAVEDVPIVIDGEEIRPTEFRTQVQPFNHRKAVAKYHYTTPDLLCKAVESCLSARRGWEAKPQEERSEIFLRAADLLSGKYRMEIVAATMLGQAKNIYQSEIDAAAELIDFLRFNVMFANNVTRYHPISPDDVTKNSMVYRGLEGFWAAICPFNFTAIGGHLAMAPALMGNVALWKPSDGAVLSNYVALRALTEAGLPPGVINFVPSDGAVFGAAVLSSPQLCGVNFTGSVRTFKHIWRQISDNLDAYRTYPRLIGECGGKNMHFVHQSADAQSVVNGTLLSAFEYNGQKCSSCSRLYVPQSMWASVRDSLLDKLVNVHMGSPLDRRNLVTAVIDGNAFNRIKALLERACRDPALSVVAGGVCDDSEGYFIQPTVIETSDPHNWLMSEEIFGPVLAVYPYPDNDFRAAAKLANETSPYGLTAAIFVHDQSARNELCEVFRQAAGNFYINDKSTGSVVGQQPFGGARLSGTNDKAGGPLYLARFISLQSVKERFGPLTSLSYPSMSG